MTTLNTDNQTNLDAELIELADQERRIGNDLKNLENLTVDDIIEEALLNHVEDVEKK